jgi:glyoxylase-like metal-dependent hydrolase (beta-lactamase superfamily II)
MVIVNATTCSSWTQHHARSNAATDQRHQDAHGQTVRYVVNNHWHYDHTDGNQVFGSGGLAHRSRERAFGDPGGRAEEPIALEFQNLPGSSTICASRSLLNGSAQKKQAENRLKVQERIRSS